MSHFDVDDNETNTNAIHDIKAVYIQQHEDIVLINEVPNKALDCEDDQTNTLEEDDDIFVNNEVTNDTEVSDDDLTNSKEEDDDVVNNRLANDAVNSGDGTNIIRNDNLSLVPIVYTTRLDEMNIFDRIEKYTPKEAAVLIQYESKPQYQQILPIKREPSSFHSYSFMKLYSDIERFNEKVQTETKIRNEELMSMCKPLKIALKNIKYDKANTTDSGSKKFNQNNGKPERSTPILKKMQAKPKIEEKALIKGVAKFQKRMSIIINDSDDSDSSEDMPLTMLKPCVINSIHILPGQTTVAFIDKTSMKTDIYIINYSKELRCSYETNSEKFDLMKKTIRSKNTVIHDVCCWVKREKQIKFITQTNIVNENAIRFMRIPHDCLPASCTCCCILEPQMPMQSSVTFLKMPNNKSETHAEASTLIRKAFSCQTKLQSSKICAVDEPIIFLKNAVIMMKYKELIVLQSYYVGENFEIGMEGDIDNHVRITINRSMAEERELHEKRDRENKTCRQYFSYLICCWYKREEIIVNLSKAHNLSPRACKYLRNPHLCKSHKCRCCCKRAKIGLILDDKNITTLLESKKHCKGVREDTNKNQINVDKSHPTIIKKVYYIDNKKYKDKTVAPGNTVAIEGKNKHNSVAVMVSYRKPETVQTTSQTIVKPSIESQPKVAKTSEPATVPPELITSIFDKLKELKLSVNANGSLTANINTPPEKLSTVEIKILAEILAQASNQMHELGIEPEEFCRRVNTKSLLLNAGPSRGIADKILHPKLPFTTQSFSLLPKQSIPPPPLRPIVKKSKENTKYIIKPPQASKRVKQKSQPCKTIKININIPKTTNSSKVANLYSMMSHTGGMRNKCMIAAYNINFDLEMDEEPEPQIKKTQYTNLEKQQLPKIVHVRSLVETSPNTNIKSNISKRKGKRSDKPESKGENCKIRVVPPERISALPITTLPISTQMDMIGLANLAKVTNNLDNPVESMPGHSKGNLYNSSLTPIQNVSGDLASPLPNAGNNVVLATGMNYGKPMIQIPDSGKIWAFMDGKLVELQCIAPNATVQSNVAFNQNSDIPKTGTNNQIPMITVSNGIPMQVNPLCSDTELKEDAKSPTINEETQESAINALLRDLLSKESSLPNIPQPTPKHRYAKTRKRPVTPLILAHSKVLESKKRKILYEPIVPKPASKENLQNAGTNSLQIIDSDEEEEESIFGV